MAENTKIEWAHHTFNPWIGCMKVGPGCDHCYAETLATARLGVEWGAGAPRRRTAASTWKQPLAWNRRAEMLGVRFRVFCSSLADVFDNEVDPAWRTDLFELIRVTPHLDWLLLTKRIGNAANMLPVPFDFERLYPNVWLGATIVNQAEADRDVPKLLATPAAKRFLSMEPLLGPVRLDRIHETFDDGRGHSWESCLNGKRWSDWGGPDGNGGDTEGHPNVDWVIVGGESGSGARPMHPDWARSLRDQCAAAGVPFLFKQWGEWFPYGEIDAEGCCNTVTRGERPGLWHAWSDDSGFSVRLGKREAGRYLDGVLHDAIPPYLAPTPDQA
ncbi:MAG: phage Gp37/Gp68 family protein [Pseudomonadota bacterium]